ncbi:DUF4406 domain-containing protein [Arthrobacter sp. SX1312]|uniref:DUF4406 domain-containing protein n=1 Tax=Arthrobacter sp. SX1312 TaxID=2058896 RepID=UPI000CE47F05|nr:DUF4406 domain-containing protein [Arthrobacter sp. SX1312]
MNALEITAAIIAYLFLAAVGIVSVGAVVTGQPKPSRAPVAGEPAPALPASAPDSLVAVYIAGPMSGLPDFNYPAFHEAEKQLQAAGYRTLNPARNPEQSSWEGYMRAGLRQLLHADAIALLPGWERSPGANIEKQLAFDLGLGVGTVDNWITIATKIGPHRPESPYRAVSGRG